MKTVFEDICKMNDATLEEFDGEADHVHLSITNQLNTTKVALEHFISRWFIEDVY